LSLHEIELLFLRIFYIIYLLLCFQAEYVYVNNGDYIDYMDLEQRNVSLRGKIFISQYGSLYRGEKVSRINSYALDRNARTHPKWSKEKLEYSQLLFFFNFNQWEFFPNQNWCNERKPYPKCNSVQRSSSLSILRKF